MRLERQGVRQVLASRWAARRGRSRRVCQGANQEGLLRPQARDQGGARVQGGSDPGLHEERHVEQVERTLARTGARMRAFRVVDDDIMFAFHSAHDLTRAFDALKAARCDVALL